MITDSGLTFASITLPNGSSTASADYIDLHAAQTTAGKYTTSSFAGESLWMVIQVTTAISGSGTPRWRVDLFHDNDTSLAVAPERVIASTGDMDATSVAQYSLFAIPVGRMLSWKNLKDARYVGVACTTDATISGGVIKVYLTKDAPQIPQMGYIA